MQPVATHRGEMSQDPIMDPLHRKPVTERRSPTPSEPRPRSGHDQRRASTIDRAARRTKGFYTTLSATSIGLEFGIAVILGLLVGRWLDTEAGTEPWLTVLFLCFGFAAGVLGVVRAMKRADKAAEEESRDG